MVLTAQTNDAVRTSNRVNIRQMGNGGAGDGLLWPLEFRHSDWLQKVRDRITSVIFLLLSLRSTTCPSCTYVLILKRVVCLSLR